MTALPSTPHSQVEETPGGVREREFRQLQGVYMNAAGFGPLPARSLREIGEFNARRHRGELGADDFAVVLEGARRAAGTLLGAGGPEEIALGPNTSAGLNVAADIVAARRSAGGDNPERRRRVVLSDREFPANVYPWLSLEREGLLVERVETDERGCPRPDALLERLRAPDVCAFALSAVQFATGYRADLSTLGRACRERDILYVVDAIQQLGAVPLDVRESGADVVVAGGQKWLCSPWGSGLAWIRRDLAGAVEPRRPGWLSFVDSLDFERLTDCRWELLADARRFEVGSIAVQDQLGLARSIELILELGQEAIWAHIKAVQEPLLAWAAGRQDARVVSDTSEAHRSGMICLELSSPADAHAALERAGITCVIREGMLRLSPHLYNTRTEMERVVDVLEEGLS